MSDPVSNHDIEDVLSSIRRLVAQGNHVTKPETPENALRSVPTSPDRLVLTPAFRVLDAPAPTESSKPDLLKMPPDFAGTTETPKASTKESVEQGTLETTIAELEAAVTHTSDDWEPDGSEGPLESSVTSAFLHKLDARQAKSPEAAVTEAVTDHIAETIADEIARGMPAKEAVPEVDESEAEIVEDDADKVTFSHTRFDEVYDPVAEATADAAEKEPGDVFGDDLAPDVDPPLGAVATYGNTHLVDQDALRLMVSEMIRTELQGEMGERITRNVRNLVRREINRVITEQDV